VPRLSGRELQLKQEEDEEEEPAIAWVSGCDWSAPVTAPKAATVIDRRHSEVGAFSRFRPDLGERFNPADQIFLAGHAGDLVAHLPVFEN
jgi:hypothetical protein